MSDTAQMLRLMYHAADRLAAEDKEIHNLLVDRVRQEGGALQGNERCAAAARLSSYMAASTLAQTVLAMVAACMEPDSDAAAQLARRVRGLCEPDETYVRIDELLAVLDDEDGAP